MPHLTLEFSGNLAGFDAKQTLSKLNQALVASGQFEEVDIKSRALACDTFLVGLARDGRAFVHVKLALLNGRPAEIKQALSSALLEVLRETCSGITTCQLQLSVEILEIERALYSKAVLTA